MPAQSGVSSFTAPEIKHAPFWSQRGMVAVGQRSERERRRVRLMLDSAAEAICAFDWTGRSNEIDAWQIAHGQCHSRCGGGGYRLHPAGTEPSVTTMAHFIDNRFVDRQLFHTKISEEIRWGNP